jgi:hypothetical protein
MCPTTSHGAARPGEGFLTRCHARPASSPDPHGSSLADGARLTIVVVPSEHLVVARLGISLHGGTGIGEVVARIISALHREGASQ